MVLGIFGAGGMGREVMIAAKESGRWDEVIFILDEEYIPQSRRIKDCRVFSIDEIAKDPNLKEDVEAIVCLGEPRDRKIVFNRLKEKGIKIGSFIDSTVQIHSDTQLGQGVIILKGSILASDIVIEDNVALSFGVILGHDNHVGAHTYLAPGLTTGGFVKWGECTFGGLRASVREKCTIGNYSVVGLGAVVVRNVESGSTVVGNPAKRIERANTKNIF